MSLPENVMSSSFVNIDLDEGKANQSVEDSTKDIPNEEVEQNDEPDMAQSVQENATPVLAEEGDKKTNEVLQRIGKQLIEDYYKYYHLNGSSQLSELNECIDNLLTHMEEFYGLLEMIRTDSAICLDQLSETVHAKLHQCGLLFGLVDKLERIVRHVSMQLGLMQNEVAKAEKMMGKKNPVKKLFSSLISNQSSSNSSHRFSYVPPDIFKTEDLMKL